MTRSAIALLLLSLAAAPARADIFRPSVEDQIRLGNQAAAEVMRRYRVVQDARAARVEQVGRRLVGALSSKERGRWQYRFRLLENRELNAFALPGGSIFLFTGLYDRMRSEDTLAAVLAHEVAHVHEQHWADQVAERSKREAGLAVILGLTRAGRTVRNIAGITNTLLTLRYSRKEEDQADAKGLRNMVAAGYDPHGMLDLFQIFMAASGGGGPAFLRSHPVTETRIRKTRERIQNLERRRSI
jgi:predicted Zn-dependent protease